MSFTAPVHARVAPVLPLAAMVDILFLLLVFFLTASSLRDQDRVIEVTLPGTETDVPGEAAPPITITVDAAGRTYIGDRAYALEDLRAKLAERAADYPDDHVAVRGDTKCEYGRVVEVVDAVRASGLKFVELRTVPIRRATGEN